MLAEDEPITSSRPNSSRTDPNPGTRDIGRQDCDSEILAFNNGFKNRPDLLRLLAQSGSIIDRFPRPIDELQGGRGAVAEITSGDQEHRDRVAGRESQVFDSGLRTVASARYHSKQDHAHAAE